MRAARRRARVRRARPARRARWSRSAARTGGRRRATPWRPAGRSRAPSGSWGEGEGERVRVRGRVRARVKVRVRVRAMVRVRARVRVSERGGVSERAPGVEEQLRERGHLRRAVPAVGAVHEHGGALDVDEVLDARGGADHAAYVLEPAALVQVLQEVVVRRVALGEQLQQRLERGAHHVDVGDVGEGELDVGVLARVLVALALGRVELRVEARPAVDDLQPLRERVGVGDRLLRVRRGRAVTGPSPASDRPAAQPGTPRAARDPT